MPTHYETLGVPSTATEDEIKRAYRRIMISQHPDRSKQEADGPFLRAIEAKHVLTDPQLRAAYDRRLRDHRATVEPPRRGIDMLTRVLLPLDVAARGGEHDLELVQPNGSVTHLRLDVPQGAEPGHVWRLEGRGGPGSPPGDLIVMLTDYVADPVFRRESLDEARARVADLPFDEQARLAPTLATLERYGLDLHADLVVTLAQAYCGDKVYVATPWSTVGVQLRPGEPPPPLTRVRGHGWRVGGVRGDLILHVTVQWPRAGDPALMQALRAADG